ncbi:hypothetical protein ACFFX0_17835 [Citricoccus parietis]|uniref:Uncharacterized protein n=1 Tax=Citricoccus parietis TaxID=592307 RepID=A0ABV5G211_9MICC
MLTSSAAAVEEPINWATWCTAAPRPSARAARCSRLAVSGARREDSERFIKEEGIPREGAVPDRERLSASGRS